MIFVVVFAPVRTLRLTKLAPYEISLPSLQSIIDPFASAQQPFSGVESNLSNLFRLSNAKTRSISPENFNGAKGAGGKATTGTGANPSRDLGQGWKVSPSVVIKPGQTFTMIS